MKRDEPAPERHEEEPAVPGVWTAPTDGLETAALRRSSLALWVAFLAPPSIALLNLEFGYVLGHIACQTASKIPVHLFMLVCLAIVTCTALIAWREWTALGEAEPGQASGPVGSRRLMALAGLIGSATAAYVILAQWFPVFLLDPCIRT